MLDPHESQMLGEIHADVRQLLINDRDKETRLKSLEASHNKLQGSIKTTQVISGGIWATFVLALTSWFNFNK
jgi:hypothetical protein